MSSVHGFRLAALFLAVLVCARARAGDLESFHLTFLRTSNAEKRPDDHAREVVPRHPRFCLWDNGKAIRPRRIDSVYVVERTEYDRVMLKKKDDRERGWAAAKDVVPVNEAESFFTAEIRSEPRHAFPYLMRAMSRGERKQFDLALADLDEALRLEPDRIEALDWRASIYSEKGKVGPALADLDHAIRLDPNEPSLYLSRTAVNQKFNGEKPELALADLDRAIRLDPGNPNPRFVRAIILAKERKYDESVADMTEALKRDPQDPKMFLGSVLILIGGRRYDMARDILSKCLKKDPDHDLAYKCLVMLALNDLGRWKFFSAMSDLQRAIDLDPTKEEAYLARSAMWIRFGFARKAMDDVNSAIRVNPKNANAYEVRSVIRYHWREYPSALADIATAVRLAPDKAEAHERLALILATCPDPGIRRGTEAVAEGSRACELSGWKKHPLVATLAAAEAEAGDFRAAVAYQEKAIGMLPKYDSNEDEYRENLDRYKANKPGYRLGLLEEWGIRTAQRTSN